MNKLSRLVGKYVHVYWGTGETRIEGFLTEKDGAYRVDTLFEGTMIEFVSSEVSAIERKFNNNYITLNIPKVVIKKEPSEPDEYKIPPLPKVNQLTPEEIEQKLQSLVGHEVRLDSVAEGILSFDPITGLYSIGNPDFSAFPATEVYKILYGNVLLVPIVVDAYYQKSSDEFWRNNLGPTYNDDDVPDYSDYPDLDTWQDQGGDKTNYPDFLK